MLDRMCDHPVETAEAPRAETRRPTLTMRYLKLLALQLRISLALGMQYRWEFLIDGALTLLWTAIGLVPLYVAFNQRPTIAGWTI